MNREDKDKVETILELQRDLNPPIHLLIPFAFVAMAILLLIKDIKLNSLRELKLTRLIKMKKIIIVIGILTILILSGCSSNSFKSCHERCMDIEKLKIDSNCDYILSDTKTVTEKCDITWEQIIDYKEECFDKCLELKNAS